MNLQVGYMAKLNLKSQTRPDVQLPNYHSGCRGHVLVKISELGCFCGVPHTPSNGRALIPGKRGHNFQKPKTVIAIIFEISTTPSVLHGFFKITHPFLELSAMRIPLVLPGSNIGLPILRNFDFLGELQGWRFYPSIYVEG